LGDRIEQLLQRIGALKINSSNNFKMHRGEVMKMVFNVEIHQVWGGGGGGNHMMR
jgi:hypothetical protein